jgi:hypothetical protein
MTSRGRLACAALCLGALLIGPSSVEAGITTIRIDLTEPLAEGAAFGGAGAYERVTGVARGEVDPGDPRNAGIVNLDRAPRNARGRVEYERDFYLLRPVDPAKGNGKILFEVNNRGRKLLFPFLMDATTGGNDPRTVADTGTGLLLRLGYTLAWSGWDPDAPRTGSGLAMRVPVPTNNGRPIVRMIREELVSGTRGQPAEIFQLSYEAATREPSAARLTVRRKEAQPAGELPSTAWTFVDTRSIRLLPVGTRPSPGSIYELYYQAKDPKVLGLGFAATRDFVSFLRYAAADASGVPNPARGNIKTALAVGISQSGRYCAITSPRASTKTSRGSGSSTACSPTSRGWAAYSSMRSSASPAEPTPSTKTTSCRRTSSPSRPRR